MSVVEQELLYCLTQPDNEVGHLQNNTESLLVELSDRLKKAGTINIETYVFLIRAKTKVLSPIPHTKAIDISCFVQAFRFKEIAYKFNSWVQQVTRVQGIVGGVVLPPLIIRANVDMLVIFPGLYLVTSEKGPIIPILISYPMNEKIYQKLIEFYNYENKVVELNNIQLYFETSKMCRIHSN